MRRHRLLKISLLVAVPLGLAWVLAVRLSWRPGFVAVTGGVDALNFVDGGRRLVVSPSRHGVIQVWDIGERGWVPPTPRRTPLDGDFMIARSRDGTLLAVAVRARKGTFVEVSDGATGRVLRHWSYRHDGLGGKINGLAFSADNRWLGGLAEAPPPYFEPYVFLYDWQAGRLVGRVPGPSNTRSAEPLPGQPLLAIYSSVEPEGCETRVVSLKLPGRAVTVWKHTSLIGPCLSPDGRQFAVLAEHIELRDAFTGAIVRRLSDAALGEPYCLTFSPDGSQLAAGGDNGFLLYRLR